MFREMFVEIVGVGKFLDIGGIIRECENEFEVIDFGLQARCNCLFDSYRFTLCMSYFSIRRIFKHATLNDTFLIEIHFFYENMSLH